MSAPSLWKFVLKVQLKNVVSYHTFLASSREALYEIRNQYPTWATTEVVQELEYSKGFQLLA